MCVPACAHARANFCLKNFKKFQKISKCANSIRQVHRELFYISSISILFSTASFFTMNYLDISLFAVESDKRLRRTLRLRWGIFIFVPVEGTDIFYNKFFILQTLKAKKQGFCFLQTLKAKKQGFYFLQTFKAKKNFIFYKL